MTPEAAEARASELVLAVRGHKAAIRRHRSALVRAAADLTALRTVCDQAGIRLIIQGEGSTHGHDDSSTHP